MTLTIRKQLFGVCVLGFAGALLLTGCESSTDEKKPDGDKGPATEAVEYAIAEVPWTTLTKSLPPKPTTDKLDDDIASGALSITEVSRYIENGTGVEEAAGEPHNFYNDLAPSVTTFDAANRKSLLYFFQSADPQVIDEESPIRLSNAYAASELSGFRPHSPWTTHFLESNTRTARRIAELGGRNYDFAIILGDVADTGEEIELEWVFTALNGGVIDPDTGINDDAVPGPGNDYNDPFIAAGLDNVPWYFAFGNHEVLYTGAFQITDRIREAAVGDTVESLVGGLNGYRDGGTEWGTIRAEGKTPADPRRKILKHEEVIEKVLNTPGQPEGHGFTQDSLTNNIGYYSFNPKGALPLRIIVLDTLNREEGNSVGWVDRTQFDWLISELNAADAADEMVIVASHHRSSDFSDGSPVSTDEFVEKLQMHDNILAHIAGHGHYSDTLMPETDSMVSSANKYWELMGPSTVDYPLQTRILELVYNGSGTVSLYVTNLDHNAAAGTPAELGRHIAAGWDYFQGSSDARGRFDKRITERNLHLVMPVRSAIEDKLKAIDAPSRVESETTLAGDYLNTP